MGLGWTSVPSVEAEHQWRWIAVFAGCHRRSRERGGDAVGRGSAPVAIDRLRHSAEGLGGNVVG